MTVQVSTHALPMLLSLMRNDAYSTYLASLNISPVDWQRLTGDELWLPAVKNDMDATLRQIVFGAIDLMSLPRPTVPAEWAAAVITILVAPSNWMVASTLWAQSPATIDLIDGDENVGNIAPIGQSRMFALCVRYMDTISDGELQLIRDKLQSVFQSGLAVSQKQPKK